MSAAEYLEDLREEQSLLRCVYDAAPHDGIEPEFDVRLPSESVPGADVMTAMEAMICDDVLASIHEWTINYIPEPDRSKVLLSDTFAIGRRAGSSFSAELLPVPSHRGSGKVVVFDLDMFNLLRSAIPYSLSGLSMTTKEALTLSGKCWNDSRESLTVRACRWLKLRSRRDPTSRVERKRVAFNFFNLFDSYSNLGVSSHATIPEFMCNVTNREALGHHQECVRDLSFFVDVSSCFTN